MNKTVEDIDLNNMDNQSIMKQRFGNYKTESLNDMIDGLDTKIKYPNQVK